MVTKIIQCIYNVNPTVIMHLCLLLYLWRTKDVTCYCISTNSFTYKLLWNEQKTPCFHSCKNWNDLDTLQVVLNTIILYAVYCFCYYALLWHLYNYTSQYRSR